MTELATRDPWHELRRLTDARIALGRTGGSQRTESVLEFRLAHARARDAVHREFDPQNVIAALAAGGVDTRLLRTAAPDRSTYLQRPDLGRRLASTDELEDLRDSGKDLAILVSDGLSALAAESHATDVVLPVVERLAAEGWTFFPVFVVPLARVKLQDEVGELLRARHGLMLLGERPGLGSPDSLGAYLTYRPRADRTNADRNCVSNIRHEGLPPSAAAESIARLLVESARQQTSGVTLR